jgi:hypothetical protein
MVTKTVTTSQSVDEQRKALSEIATRGYRAAFHRTLNGVHAWLGYSTARRLRLPVPEWVAKYLDDCAADILASDGTRTPTAIADALSLRTKGGGKSARARAKTSLRQLSVAEYVLCRIGTAKTGTPDELIFAEAAERFQLSTSRVKNIFYEWTDRPKKVRPSHPLKHSHKLR